MNNFSRALKTKIDQSQSNNYGVENYDEFRFGKYKEPKKPSKGFVYELKQVVKKLIGHKSLQFDINQVDWIRNHQQGLERIYERLNDQGKGLLIDLIAYRKLGFKKVKLPRNSKQYWDAMAKGDSLADPNDTYDPHFMHFILNKFDLNPIGYDIKLYFSGGAIAIDYILEQYAYKLDGKPIVQVEPGDVVIDAGACWGDTALYFAHKVGENGKVYSFEFIPDNIKLFNINRSFNPHLTSRIELIEHPISNVTGDKIFFKDNGPGSKVEMQPFEGQTGSTTTITIDDLVKKNNIEKVNFIKMDIEGAEPNALKGAIETIKKFRPKLAIATYHSMDDFVNIPIWILDLDLNYEIFLDHYTIHKEETVCFAIPR